jgi:hypothetical protein
MEYIFYETDESFDYGDWSWGGTWEEHANHGFEIEIDNDKIDMSSFNAFGDYEEMNHKCKTLEDLKNYILEHYDEIQEFEGFYKYSNKEVFNELLEIIDDNLQKAA